MGSNKKGSAKRTETYINPPKKEVRSVKIRLLSILPLNEQKIYN